MLFGIVVAASSSIFIAAPILLFLGDWRQRRRARLAAADAVDVAAVAPAPLSADGDRQ
jgi:SecD/SecF fusion protein